MEWETAGVEAGLMKCLGTSLSKSEYTVVNVGGPDGPPRLVCHLCLMLEALDLHGSD